jgi:hypothetical protein
MANEKIIIVLFISLLIGIGLGSAVADRDVLIGSSNVKEINDLTDVDTTGVAVNKILKYNGTMWAIADDESGGEGSSLWSRDGTTLYTLNDNDKVQLNDTLSFDNDYNFSIQSYNGNWLELSINDGSSRYLYLNNEGSGYLGLQCELFELNHPTATILLDSDEVAGSGMTGVNFATVNEYWLISNENAYDNDFLIRDSDATLDCIFIENDNGNVTISQGLNITEHCRANAFHGDGGNLTNISAADGYAGDEGHPHNQDLNSTSAVTFATVNTGQGNNDLYDMNQNVKTTNNVLFMDIRADDDLTVDDDATVKSSLAVWNDCSIGQPDNRAELSVDGEIWVEEESEDIAIGEGSGLLMFYKSATGSYFKSVVYAEEAISEYAPMYKYAKNYEWYLGDTKGATDLEMVLDNSGGKNIGFLGVGVDDPETRIMIPESEDEAGTGTAYDWAVYSDNRKKDWINELPENKVIQFCENVGIQMYNPINVTRDEYNNLIFGDTDTSKVNVGISAQNLYNYVENAFGAKYANSVVNKPVDEDKSLWTVSYRNVNLIFDRMVQINHDRLTNMENWLMQYGYDPTEEY